MCGLCASIEAQAAGSPYSKGKLLQPKVNSVTCLLYAATLPSYDCVCVCQSGGMATLGQTLEWQLYPASRQAGRHYNYPCLLYRNRQLMNRTTHHEPGPTLPRLIHQINRRNIECHQAYCLNKGHNYMTRPNGCEQLRHADCLTIYGTQTHTGAKHLTM